MIVGVIRIETKAVEEAETVLEEALLFGLGHQKVLEHLHYLVLGHVLHVLDRIGHQNLSIIITTINKEKKKGTKSSQFDDQKETLEKEGKQTVRSLAMRVGRSWGNMEAERVLVRKR